MDDELLRAPALSFGGRTVEVADLLLIGQLSGTWPAFLDAAGLGVALQKRCTPVPGAEVRAAATAFRYERGLLSASEFVAWLSGAGLQAGDLAGVLGRAWLRARHPDTGERGDVEGVLRAELLCSGTLATLVREATDRLAAQHGLGADAPSADPARVQALLAAAASPAGGLPARPRASVAAGPAAGRPPARPPAGPAAGRPPARPPAGPAAGRPPARPPAGPAAGRPPARPPAGQRADAGRPLALLSGLPDLPRRAELAAAADAALAAFAVRIADPAAIRRRLADHRLDWLRVSGEECAFTREGAAREARLLVREGAPLADVARLAGLHADPCEHLVGAASPAVAGALASAAPGELVGPWEQDGRWRVLVVTGKVAPHADDPELRARAARELREDALARLSAGRVRRHVAL